MTRNIESRLQKLEAQQHQHIAGDAVVAFYMDGVFVRAQRDGETYDGPLEGHRIVSRVNFVTPRPFVDDVE